MGKEIKRSPSEIDPVELFLTETLETNLGVVRYRGYEIDEEPYIDKDAQRIAERALPVAITLFKGAASYYSLEEKAKSAAANFAREDRWRDAANAATVSDFFKAQRVNLVNLLKSIAGMPGQGSYYDGLSVWEALNQIEQIPHLMIPDLPPKDEDSSEFLRDLYYGGEM